MEAVRNERLVREEWLENIGSVVSIIDAVRAAGRPNVRAVNVRSKGHHVLVDHAAQDGVHAHLISLTERNLLSQEGIALVHRRVLLVGAIAVSHSGAADALCELCLHDRFNFSGGVEVQDLLTDGQ